MSYALLAGAAFLNAFVCCGLIQMMMRTVIKNDWRYLITFIMYTMLAFVMVTPGEGLFKVDFSQIDFTLFILYVIGGFCCCLMFFITHRIKENGSLFKTKPSKSAKKEQN